jgi:hypothetical protein
MWFAYALASIKENTEANGKSEEESSKVEHNSIDLRVHKGE